VVNCISCVKSAFLDVQKAQETPIQTGMAGFQYSNTEACRCNNISHRARFHGFKIEKYMCLSGFTVYKDNDKGINNRITYILDII
jgi:hypothetical protein